MKHKVIGGHAAPAGWLFLIRNATRDKNSNTAVLFGFCGIERGALHVGELATIIVVLPVKNIQWGPVTPTIGCNLNSTKLYSYCNLITNICSAFMNSIGFFFKPQNSDRKSVNFPYLLISVLNPTLIP